MVQDMKKKGGNQGEFLGLLGKYDRFIITKDSSTSYLTTEYS